MATIRFKIGEFVFELPRRLSPRARKAADRLERAARILEQLAAEPAGVGADESNFIDTVDAIEKLAYAGLRARACRPRKDGGK